MSATDSRLHRAARSVAWLVLVLSMMLGAGTAAFERHTHGPLDFGADCAACLAIGTAPDAPPSPDVLPDAPLDFSTQAPPIADEANLPAPPHLAPHLRAPPTTA